MTRANRINAHAFAPYSRARPLVIAATACLDAEYAIVKQSLQAAVEPY